MRAEEFHRRGRHRPDAIRASIVQTELPHRNVRSNSLEVCGNLMAVAYQTGTHGATPAGIELFDIAKPEEPRSVGFFDCSGPRIARRAPALVRRWQDHPLLVRRRRLHPAQSAGRPVLSRHRRQRSDQAARTRPLVVSRHARGRRRAAGAAASAIRHRLARAQHQRLSRSSRPRLYRLYRRRRGASSTSPTSVRRSWSAIGIRIRHSPASCTR